MKTTVIKRQSVLSPALLVLLLFNACGGDDNNGNTNPVQPTPTPPPPTVVAVVANQASNNVSAYTINGSTGALAAVAGSHFSTAGTTPGGIAVSSDGALAYVAKTPLTLRRLPAFVKTFARPYGREKLFEQIRSFIGTSDR